MPSYVIDGFEIECVEPTPWALRLTWQNGATLRWPAASRAEAVAQQAKISLRPDLMARIEIETPDGALQALWDVRWPSASYTDLLAFPEDLSPGFIAVMERSMSERS